MIKIKIEDKIFKLASGWDEVTFAMYINILNVAQNTEVSGLQRSAQIIAAISDNDFECYRYLLQLDRPTFDDLESKFTWLDEDMTFLKNVAPAESFEFEGRKFIVNKNYSKLSLGTMINIETLIETYPNLTNFEIVFGNLIQEEKGGKQVDIDEQQFISVLTFLKDKVMLKEVYSLLAFFLSGEKKSTSSSSLLY